MNMETRHCTEGIIGSPRLPKGKNHWQDKFRSRQRISRLIGKRCEILKILLMSWITVVKITG
ncbi:hypothetical protein E2C01_068632 [Portunus trituberculatus]|uniref:Uncharacterized protein n=1 Tax=Portunus trituberculatus TaxID=210409 RepID=A0A5B7HWN9_PORTR|nr:hypothetical protein [Portunus trituberculatus]